MIIKRVLNNNVVIVDDVNGIEKIVCGKGIGFSKSKGDEIDKNIITQVFVLEQNNNMEKLILSIPIEYFELSKKIFEIIIVKLNNNYKESLKLTLADHIFGLVKRNQDKIKPLKNALLWDLKHFYEKEFEIANEASKLIKDEFDIELNDDEKGFIVLHLLNAQIEVEEQSAFINKIIKEIQQVIRLNLKINLNENGYNYTRLSTHLKYFALRMLKPESSEKEMEDSFFDFIKSEYYEAFKVSEKVFDFLKKQYEYNVDKNEMIYLTIHIQRLIKN